MVMVTDRELDPPLQAIEAKPLTVGVHVAVEVTCTEEWGFAVVTTTALAVAQYCKALVAEAAEGNTKSLLVLSRLVTVTISRLAAELVVVVTLLLQFRLLPELWLVAGWW